MAIRKRCQRGVRHELGGVVRDALVHGIFAAHFDVAAERDGVDAVVGVAFAEAERRLPKPMANDLHAHAQPLGHGIVAELVDQDHESEDDDDGDSEVKNQT